MVRVRKKLKKLKAPEDKIDYLELQVRKLKASMNAKEYVFKEVNSESDSEVEIALDTYKRTAEEWCLQHVDKEDAFDEDELERSGRPPTELQLSGRREARASGRPMAYAKRFGARNDETGLDLDSGAMRAGDDSPPLLKQLHKVETGHREQLRGAGQLAVTNDETDRMALQSFLDAQRERRSRGLDAAEAQVSDDYIR